MTSNIFSDDFEHALGKQIADAITAYLENNPISFATEIGAEMDNFERCIESVFMRYTGHLNKMTDQLVLVTNQLERLNNQLIEKPTSNLFLEPKLVQQKRVDVERDIALTEAARAQMSAGEVVRRQDTAIDIGIPKSGLYQMQEEAQAAVDALPEGTTAVFSIEVGTDEPREEPTIHEKKTRKAAGRTVREAVGAPLTIRQDQQLPPQPETHIIVPPAPVMAAITALNKLPELKPPVANTGVPVATDRTVLRAAIDKHSRVFSPQVTLSRMKDNGWANMISVPAQNIIDFAQSLNDEVEKAGK